jgi:hypothetical protein
VWPDGLHVVTSAGDRRGDGKRVAVIGYCEGCRRNTYVGEMEERACPACGRSLIGTKLETGRGRAIGANQSSFRDLNEKGTDPATRPRLSILCECGTSECAEPIEVDADDYTEVRSHPARFIVLKGHMVPEAETTVGSGDTWVVVEKLGEARDEAIAQAQAG